MYFTTIEFRRVDYAESDVNVPMRPPEGAVMGDLGTLVYTWSSSVYPARDEIFSLFDLPVSRESVLSANYMKLTLAEDATSYDTSEKKWKGSTHTMYGWIDSATAISDTAKTETTTSGTTPLDYRVTEIRWHPDWWASCIPYTKLGYGLVSRRPRSDYDPPQPLNPNVVYTDVVTTLVKNEDPLWIVMGIIYASGGTTFHRLCFWPVFLSGADSYISLGQSTTGSQTVSLTEVITGDYVSAFAVGTDKITSAYISPVAPYKLEGGTGVKDNPWYLVGKTPIHTDKGKLSESKFPYIHRLRGAGENFPTAAFYTTDTSEGFRDDFWKYQSHDGKAYYGYRDCTIDDWRGASTGAVFNGPFHFDVRTGDTVHASTSDLGLLRVVKVSDMISALGISSVYDGDTFKVSGSAYIGYFTSGELQHTTKELEILSPVGVRWNVQGWTATSETSFEKGAWSDYVVLKGDISDVAWEFSTAASSTDDVAVTTIGSRSVFYSLTEKYADTEVSFSEVETTDTSGVMVTDWTGRPCVTLPWGFPVSRAGCAVVLSTGSAYVRIRFDGLNSASEGLEVMIPLPTLAVIQSAWSEYLYSGQRESDVAQARIACEAAMINAVAGGVEGAATGALIGGINIPQKGADAIASAKGSVVGAGGGIVSGLVGAAVQRWQAGELQSVKDTTVKKQGGSIIVNSTGLDWIRRGRGIALVRMTPDIYSLTRWSTDILLNGVRVSEAWTDSDSLLDSAGPLRFDDVQVYMNSRSGAWMPVEAQKYIKQRLIRGVRLQ